MRGHTLVWHNHQPKALDDYIQDHYNGNMEDDKTNNPEKFRSKRKELTKSFLAEYMKNVGERYPNCYCWDVINEIVPDVHTPKPSTEIAEVTEEYSPTGTNFLHEVSNKSHQKPEIHLFPASTASNHFVLPKHILPLWNPLFADDFGQSSKRFEPSYKTHLLRNG